MNLPSEKTARKNARGKLRRIADYLHWESVKQGKTWSEDPSLPEMFEYFSILDAAMIAGCFAEDYDGHNESLAEVLSGNSLGPLYRY